MAGFIQDDVREIMEDAADPMTPTAGLQCFVVSTVGMTEEQLKSIESMLRASWTCGHTSSWDYFKENGKSSYIHDDIEVIMDKAANPNEDSGEFVPSTVGMNADQLKSLNIILQYAWNRGYKSACQDINDNE